MSNRLATTLKKLAHAVVIVLLVIIPVPVGRLFARLFDKKPKAIATLVVRREDDAMEPISLDTHEAPRE